MTDEQIKRITDRIVALPLYGDRSGKELANMLLEAAGHPEKAYRIIHIAGTNGKGTTAVYTAAIMTAAGYRVGLYTSPHLISITERIRINGKMIDEAAFARIGELVLALDTPNEPTFSDVVMVMALLYFKEAGCDYAVIETGLGGRLDSTNAIGVTPEVTAITRIGLDHTALLGDSIEKIAAEKAGIIKADTKVVIADMEPAAKAVIEDAAKRVGAKPHPSMEAEIIRKFSDKENLCGTDGRDSSVEGTGGMPNGIDRLLLSYLAENIGNAARITQLILPDEKWQPAFGRALKNTRTPGRLELLEEEPFVLFDGAHNPQGAKALARTLEAWFGKEKCIFLIGMFQREDAKETLFSYVPLAKRVYAVDLLHERNYGAKQIARFFTTQHVSVANPKGSFDPQRVYAMAKEEAKETGCRLIICGSLHLYEGIKQ